MDIDNNLEEKFTNEIVVSLKDYFRKNNLGTKNLSFEDKLKMSWIISPEKVIKNSWYNNFGDINKRMDGKLDSLLFGVSNKFFFFESFVMIRNNGKILKYQNKNYYKKNNLSRYNYFENGTKRYLDYSTLFYEIVDYKEFLKNKLEYKVISEGIRRFYLFSFGEKSYCFEESKIDVPSLNLIFDELTSLLGTGYSKYKKHEEKIENRKLKELEKTRIKRLKESQSNLIRELDKDGNGEVDVVEGNDFKLLLKKHQDRIIELDRNYVQQFVKVSSYLKTKKENIQSIFHSIKDTPNQDVLNEYIEIIKDEIHNYNLVLFNSLNMIVSLVEEDMVTFFEIHEVFDSLNMFDSKHEKDVSHRLKNIGDGLETLMYEIRDVGNQISNSIGELGYITEESNRKLTMRLREIDSSVKTNNLLTTIQTYQMYKVNQNTKGLRK